MNHSTELTDFARAAADAIQQVCRATSARPRMTPAEVADVLADLAAAVAALPQVAGELSTILEQTQCRHALQMDGMTETEDPDLAIDVARRHLNAIGEPTLGLYRLLDAAHNETAHIAVADRVGRRGEDAHQIGSIIGRPEHRRPPPTRSGGAGAPPPR